MRIDPKLIVLTFLFLTVACSANGSNNSIDGSTEVAGPALIMFYTDN